LRPSTVKKELVVILYKVVATGLLAISCFASSASALSITNRDDHDQKITIVEGGASKDQVLKPEATVEGICLKGCVIRLNDSDDDEYELEGTEVVSIEDGYLYYDSPEAPAEAPAPDGKGAQPKK
jgi:hypothetical protein